MTRSARRRAQELTEAAQTAVQRAQELASRATAALKQEQAAQEPLRKDAEPPQPPSESVSGAVVAVALASSSSAPVARWSARATGALGQGR